MTRYKVRQIESIEDFDEELLEFFVKEAENIANLFENKFNWRNFDLSQYLEEGLIAVCYKNDRPVGGLLMRLYPSVFDGEVKILMQDLLYCKKDSGRAATLLMRLFIAFGRANADLVFTMRAPQTNIKSSSLKKLGFKEVETLFCLES